MKHRCSSADREFRKAFEACEVSADDFDHAAHVRLAYACLCAGSQEQAFAAMKQALLNFLNHLDIGSGKYHETITRSWIMAVHHFMQQSPPCASASEFIARNPDLLDSKIMLSHYSAELLFSDRARAEFVPPDIQPIPPD